MLASILGSFQDAKMPGMLAAAGIAVITGTLLLRRIKGRHRLGGFWFGGGRARDDGGARGSRRSDADGMPVDAKEKLKRIADRATAHERLEKVMVEAQEATRACAAQIGTRTAKLEALLDQADQRMQRMEQLATRLEALLERAYADAPVGPAPVAVRESASSPSPAPRRREALRVGGGEDTSGFFSMGEGLSRAEASDPLSRRVYGLADEGLPPAEIARKLEEQIGKVELILALRG